MDIPNTTKIIEHYILSEKYEGYDPFDLLLSPLFKSGILKNNKPLRFYSQQVFRRIPSNLRPVLGIKKGINPVTLGLCIQSFSYLTKVYTDKELFYKAKIEECLDLLNEIKSKNYSGTSWGYNFDWEARYTRIDAYVPTIVATGIITNCLYTYNSLFKDERVKEIITSAAEFTLRDLNRFYENENYCLSYSPVDKQKVHNASMKGARLLAQAYSLTGNPVYLNESKKIISFTMHHQKEDGSWPYSYQDARTWSDNFHTAYVLDCLKDYMELTGDKSFEEHYAKGYKYYKENFFVNGMPKYYNNKFYPIDSTCNAQSIITLSKNNDIKLASQVAEFAVKKMYNEKGYFYYQANKYFTHKTPYMRWSTAYMFAGLASLLYYGELKQ